MQPLILMHVFIHPPMALSRQHKLLVVSQDLKKNLPHWVGGFWHHEEHRLRQSNIIFLCVVAAVLSDKEGLVAEISVKRECRLGILNPVDLTKSRNLELIS